MLHNLALIEFALKVINEGVASELREYPPEELLWDNLDSTLLKFNEFWTKTIHVEFLGQIIHILCLEEFFAVVDGEWEG